METLLMASRDAAILAVATGGLLLVAGRRIPAGWRHGLWLLVAVRLLMPALPTSPVSWQRVLSVEEKGPGELYVPRTLPVDVAPIPNTLPPEHASSLSDGPLVSNEIQSKSVEPPREPLTIWEMAFGIWISGVVVLLATGSLLTVRFGRQLKRLAVPFHPRKNELEALLEALGIQFGWRKLPRLEVTEAVDAPALFGIFRPTILIPPAALDRLSATELRLVLLHELGHWRRRDLWVNLALALLQAIHWFNPLVWWAFHRTRVEGERATDAWVLRRAGAEHVANYGGMLLRLLDPSPKPRTVFSGIVSVVESPNDLKRRMVGIVKFSGERNPWAVVGSVAIMLLLAAVGLTQSPGAPGGSSADFSEQRGESFVSRVVSTDGSPVMGAEVFLHATSTLDGKDIDPPELIGRTDSSGLCEIPIRQKWIESGNMRLDLYVRHHEFGPTAISIGRPKARSEIEIAFSKGSSLRFLITDEKGHPVRGLRLRVVTAQISATEYVNPGKFSAMFRGTVPPLPGGFWNVVTDDQGRCEFKDLAGGLYYIDHGDARYGQIPGRRNQSFQYNPAKNSEEIKLVLPPAATVSGRVLLPDGSPVSGARVEITEANRNPKGGITAEAITDAAGRYQLDRLLDTDYHLAVDPGEGSDTGWISEIMRVSLKTGEHRENVNPKFSKGALVAGRVTFVDTGAGVGGLAIGIAINGRISPLAFAGIVTDKDGSFRKRVRAGKLRVWIPGPVPDGYALETSDGKGTAIELKAEEGGTCVADFTLRLQELISGIVVDPAGIPVVGANITCLDSKTHPFSPYSVVTTEGGRFSFAVASGVREVRLVAESEDLVSPIEMKYPVGKEPIIRLKENQLASASGRILDQKGDPLAGALVKWDGEKIVGIPIEATTDEKGNYMAAKIFPGERIDFFASKEGFGQKSVHLDLNARDVAKLPDMTLLSANAFVLGKVVDSKGKPVFGVQVRAIGEHPAGAGSTSTDRDGRFEMHGLVEGWLNLHLIKTSLDGNIGTQARVKSGRKDVVITLPEGLAAE